jgi:hypothetical protein
VLIVIDGYRTQLGLKEARADEKFLACAWNDEPLPISHGFPLRAISPAVQGNVRMKWQWDGDSVTFPKRSGMVPLGFRLTEDAHRFREMTV